jgi:hypothetical protein
MKFLNLVFSLLMAGLSLGLFYGSTLFNQQRFSDYWDPASLVLLLSLLFMGVVFRPFIKREITFPVFSELALNISLVIGFAVAGLIMAHGIKAQDLSELGTALAMGLLFPLYILLFRLLLAPFVNKKRLESLYLHPHSVSEIKHSLMRDVWAGGTVFVAGFLMVGLAVWASSPQNQATKNNPNTNSSKNLDLNVGESHAR